VFEFKVQIFGQLILMYQGLDLQLKPPWRSCVHIHLSPCAFQDIRFMCLSSFTPGWT